MDPHHLPIFFFIISQLPGGRLQTQVFGDPCDGIANLCIPSNNLECKNGFCACTLRYDQDPTYPDRCTVLLLYGDACGGIGTPGCKPAYTCRNGLCSCPNPTDVNYGLICGPPKGRGQSCFRDDVCDTSLGLICDVKSGKCDCDPPNFWGAGRCVAESTYGQPCASPANCKQLVLLTCINAICDCDNSLVSSPLVPDRGGGCGPRAQLGDLCDLPECEPALNLECQGRCVCKPNHIVVPMKPCQLVAKLGQPCSSTIPCHPNGFMDCKNNICTCLPDYVPFPNGICGPPARHAESCNPPPCKPNANLVCDALDHCACTSPNLVILRDKTCAPKAKLGQFCQDTGCEDGPGWNLICPQPYFQCACTSGNVNLDGMRCGTPDKLGKLGDKCDQVLCATKLNLVCSPNKICDCVPDNVEYPMKACGLPPVFGQPCGPPPVCKENSNLICTPGPSSKCACSSPDLTHHPDLTCGPKAKLREGCNLPICEDGQDWHLTCQNFVCECTPGYVEWDGLRCGPIGKLGDKCDLPICDPNGNLECNAAKTCVCTTGNVEYPMKACGLPPLFGQPCGPLPKCKENSNLICPPGPSSKCACSSPDLTPYQDKTCGPKAKLWETCNLPICEDGPDWHLACHLINFKCVCTPGYVEWDGLRCGPIGKLGDKCDLPICDKSLNLVCGPKKTCECGAGTVEHPMKTCGPAPLFGEPCGPLPKCKENSNLICPPGPSSVCACSSPDLTPYPDLTCGPKGKLREACDLFQCEDGPDWHLTCHLTNFKCVCTPGYVEWDGLRCGPIGKLGDKCDHPICAPNGNLECAATKTCVCTTGNVEHKLRVCGPPAVLRGKCGPPICEPGRNLTCKSGHCVCLNLYEDDYTGGCYRTASNYGQPCQVDSECKQGQNMFCDLQSKTCDCLPHYDLDNLGETPCVFNRFNGRTYGQACDQTKQIRSCVVAHNLTCNGNTCVCIDDHIPDKSTEKDPAIGVTTCKLAAGTQGRGDPCVPNSHDITQKCDTLLDIACHHVHKVCICAPGFVPTVGKLHPCDGGTQKFDAACDPPEVIVPPRGIDPITGLPLPGPTSPPPPKYACDPTLKLFCVNGKCTCQDQVASKRYRLDPKSGKCLITDGYACVVNADCISGKCAKRSETVEGPSHGHDERVCTGPPSPPNVAPSAISGLSFLQVFLIGQLILQF